MMLYSKYGDVNRSIQSHIDYIEALNPNISPAQHNISELYIDCNSQIQSLRALGEDVNALGCMIAPKILRAFPEDICRRWISHTKHTNVQETDLEKLMAFLNIETESALATAHLKGEPAQLYPTEEPVASTFLVNTKKNLKPMAKPSITSAAKAAASTKPSTSDGQPRTPWCAFCNGTHYSQDCPTIMNPRVRSAKLKEANRCYICLRKGHTAKRCYKRYIKCCICKRSHHTAICETPNPPCTDTSQATATYTFRSGCISAYFIYNRWEN